MKKKRQAELVVICADIASKAEHIKCYIFLYETDDGAIHRASSGSQMAQVGLMSVYKDRLTDDYRDFMNAPRNME